MSEKRQKDLLTVKEFAEASGVTQQAVYQRLNKSLQSFVVEIEGKKYLKREALSNIQEKAEPKPVEQGIEQDSINVEQGLNKADGLIETLQKTVELLSEQLEVKDQQIHELNKRLEQALNNTSQSHFIAAQAQKSISGGEHEADPATADSGSKEKGLFARLFKKG